MKLFQFNHRPDEEAPIDNQELSAREHRHVLAQALVMLDIPLQPTPTEAQDTVDGSYSTPDR